MGEYVIYCPKTDQYIRYDSEKEVPCPLYLSEPPVHRRACNGCQELKGETISLQEAGKSLVTDRKMVGKTIRTQYYHEGILYSTYRWEDE